MALHSRLVAPSAPPPQEWPWHKAKWMSLPLRDLWSGDRRLEAENYLASAYGLRLAMERKAKGWQRLSTFAHVSQPMRLKGIQVASEHGVPFLAATQVFDLRPIPRKWLAMARTHNAAGRFVKTGQILVTRSGAVGRATLASTTHEKILISDDLLRVDARDDALHGWLYAYLRAPQTRAMMSGAQYGHIIKHLETAHLDALPVPEVNAAIAADFEGRVVRLLELRKKSYLHTVEAERLFEDALGPLKISNWGESGFSVRASKLITGRRRLDGVYSNPGVSKLYKHLQKCGKTLVPLRDLGVDVWLPTRFRRIPASDGVWFLDSSDIFEVIPDITKRIAETKFGDSYNGRVKAGWLLLARSGQTYGLNGSTVLASKEMEGKVVSDHVVRVAPHKNCQIRMGYLHTVLSHPLLGRPLVKALAYGSSIPEIEPADFADFRVVRLDDSIETSIADHAEASAENRSQADTLERELSEDAGRIIDQFLSSGTVVHMKPVFNEHDSAHQPTPLVEHVRVRLRRGLPEHQLRAGAKGTVVHVYGHGEGLEVEFGASGKWPKVITLDGDAVEPLAD